MLASEVSVTATDALLSVVIMQSVHTMVTYNTIAGRQTATPYFYCACSATHISFVTSR